jgi:rSAM/selenodomain-associated transferase 1
MSRRALVVFAKLPVPGAVKTRMCPPLTPERAADLYTQMLGDVLEASAEVCERGGAELFITLTPADGLLRFADDFAGHFNGSEAQPAMERVRLIAQAEGDLGARMQHAFAEAAAAGYDRIVLRGSDSPTLAPAQLARAFDVLDEVDVAIGPDVDGGYNWIAARRAHEGLLDHEMSTGSVARDTLAAAARLGLTTHVGPTSFDLDTAEDLERLRSEASALPEGLARRTLAWLD